MVFFLIWLALLLFVVLIFFFSWVFWLSFDCSSFCHKPEIGLDLSTLTTAHVFVGPHFSTAGCQQALPVDTLVAPKCLVTDH